METIIIIALVLFWLALTLGAGMVIETVTAEIAKNKKKHIRITEAKKNIKVLPAGGGYECKKIAS